MIRDTKNIVTYLSLILLATLVLGLVGCQSNRSELEEEVSIPLSKSKIVFDKSEGHEQVIAQVSPETKLDYFLSSEVDWLSVKIEQNIVHINTKENSSNTIKKTTLVLFCERKMGQIEIIQNAKEDLLTNTFPLEVTLSPQGGKKIIPIPVDSDRWDISPESPKTSWISIVAMPTARLLEIRADKNSSTSERTANILITLPNGSTRTINVRQPRYQDLLIPFQTHKRDLVYKDIIQYEEERGSTLTFFQKGDAEESYFSSPDILVFHTPSEAMPKITYTRDVRYDNVYENAQIEVTDDLLLTESGAFAQYLLSIGYRKLWDHTVESIRLESPDGYFYVSTKRDTANDEDPKSYIVFTPQYVQENPMPTLPHFPIGHPEVWSKIKIDNIKYAEIKAWEESEEIQGTEVIHFKANGGDFPQQIALALFRTKSEGKDYDTEAYRWYDFYVRYKPYYNPPDELLGSVMNVKMLFRDLSKLIYFVDKNKTKYKTTNEFKKLLRDNGFEYRGISSSQGETFYSVERGMNLFVQLANLSSVVSSEKELLAMVTLHKPDQERPRVAWTPNKTTPLAADLSPITLTRHNPTK